jgi:hypothetical protein
MNYVSLNPMPVWIHKYIHIFKSCLINYVSSTFEIYFIAFYIQIIAKPIIYSLSITCNVTIINSILNSMY